MKHFYYFSKSRLKFVEIRNFYRKFVFLILFFSVLFSFFIFSTHYIVKSVLNPDAEVESLQSENIELKNQLNSMLEKYTEFENDLDLLSEKNDDLRLAVNLSTVEEEEKMVGYGGQLFDFVKPSNSKELGDLITKLNSEVQRISSKVSFEKNNYKEIEDALEFNAKLYDAIPAIKPCEGRYSSRFGMRLHPVLKIRRMHTGQDIVCNMGSNVYATGGGEIVSIRRYSTLGLAVTIDHGFGYRTVYGHLSKTNARVGQKVKRGDLIAFSGNSGRLTSGPHVHYEVRHNGIALNPRNFIYDDVNIFEIVSKENN